MSFVNHLDKFWFINPYKSICNYIESVETKPVWEFLKHFSL